MMSNFAMNWLWQIKLRARATAHQRRSSDITQGYITYMSETVLFWLIVLIGVDNNSIMCYII